MGEQDKILSQHEIDALLSAIESGSVEVGAGAAATATPSTPYDFKRPERVARDQLRALETLHEVFCRNLQTTLSGMLRTVIDVDVASVDQLTFSEFINSLPNPTVFNVITFEPLEGNFILEISPTIAFPVIERMLGSGRIGAVIPEREFSPIEWSLVDRVVGRALDLLKQVWSPIVQVEPKVSSKGSNPQLMQIMSPNEPVVMIVIEMTAGEHKGYMNICIPVMMIEPVMERISTRMWFTSRRRESQPGQERQISRTLSEAEVLLVAHLQAESIEVGQLKNLKSGDVVRLSHPKDRPVYVSVEGRPKFRARLGESRDRRAISISTVVPPEEVHKGLQPVAGVVVEKGKGKAETGTARAPGSGGAGFVEGLLKIPVVSQVVLTEKEMSVRDVLGLKAGDVIEFEKRLEQPLSLRAGQREIAQGVAVKIGERFGLQVTQVLPPQETLRALGTP